MHIPPGSGKASAVVKLQYVATGRKSKTESEGVGGAGTESRERDKRETKLNHLRRLLLFSLDFFSPHNSSCKQTPLLA